MTYDELAARVRANAEASGLRVSTLRLQPDPYGGWRLALVSPDFDRMDTGRRRESILRGLDGEAFQWLELLAPDEAEWAGDLLPNATLEDLPMWPEALARQAPADDVLFASDLDEDLKPPIIATFHSLRGGVGRSTALAYAARILARRGHSVLCLDMDLEAPGLASLFGKEDEVRPDQGIVALLLALEQGERPDMLQHILRLSDADELYCLPAGIPDANYARRLRLLDPESWYREAANPLHTLLDGLAELSFKPDLVLVDARTGIAPFNAPLLFDVSDLAIITFFPHPQARTGTRALVRALLRTHTRRKVAGRRLTPEPRFLVSPVPAGRDQEMQRYRHRALDWINEWLQPIVQRRETAPPLDVEDMCRFIPYRELLATADRVLEEGEAWPYYEPVADWLERFVPVKSEQQLPPDLERLKPTILEGLEFSGGIAEDQRNFLESFVTTEVIERALSTDMPLVLGRKGTGKTAVFRRLREGRGDKPEPVVVLSPARYRAAHPWILSPEGFEAIDALVRDNGVAWRSFWTAYTALGVFLSRYPATPGLPVPAAPLSPCVRALTTQAGAGIKELSEREIIDCLERMLTEPRAGLLAWEWLQGLDRALGGFVPLLFDGLDTGFGSSGDERNRRTRAIEGLFDLVTDRAQALQHLRFKVLLREDIWKMLEFQNKSHLYGRSVRLEWHTQSDYMKTLLKQAMQQVQFRTLITNSRSGSTDIDVDHWPEALVFQAWNILVGERMKGGKTTFTRNWIWNRLADGNTDHTPRALLQLFQEAVAWERMEHPKNPYGRTVIRPRALIQSLGRVSQEALAALVEEFKELEPLVQRLGELGYSPIDAKDLKGVAETRLGREVGLLSIYEGTEQQVLRYRVPDLYLTGIGMTRKGQA